MALGPALASSPAPFTCFLAPRLPRGPTPATAGVSFGAAAAAAEYEPRLRRRWGGCYFPEGRRGWSSAGGISVGGRRLTRAVARSRVRRHIFGGFRDRRDRSGCPLIVRAGMEPSDNGECGGGRKFRILSVFVGRGSGILVIVAIWTVLVMSCRSVLAQESVSQLTVGVLGRSGMALRDAWPKILQVLCVFREQGLILAALLGLSAFFSMAETSITTLWPWKVLLYITKEVTKAKSSVIYSLILPCSSHLFY